MTAQVEDIEEVLIDLYESAMLHGEAQANGVLPTPAQREKVIILAKTRLEQNLKLKGLAMSSTNKRTPNLSQTSPVAPIDTNSEIELVKQLLMGAIYRTYDTVNMDKTYVGGEPTVEKGVDIETAFEKQWEFILPHLTQLLITERQRTCDLIEADLPPEDGGSAMGKNYWSGHAKGSKDFRDHTLAVIRRQRGKK